MPKGWVAHGLNQWELLRSEKQNAELLLHLDAFKSNLKELTTKSALSAWGQRSLACACPVAGYIDHVIHRRVQFPFMLGSVSHFLPLPPSPYALLVFLHWCFSVWWVPVPFLWCGGSWLGCTVVPVMGALFQSRSWLSIVEAPWYTRHQTSILAMQLLTTCNSSYPQYSHAEVQNKCHMKILM